MEKFTKIYNEAIPTGQGLGGTPKPKKVKKPGSSFLSKVGKVASAITTGQQIAKGDYDLRGLKDIDTNTATTSAAQLSGQPVQATQPPAAPATPATPTNTASLSKFKKGDIVEYTTNAGKIRRATVTGVAGKNKVIIQLPGLPTRFSVPETRIGKKLGRTP